MVKPLSFKGDKKQMKRKRPEADKETEDGPSTQLRKLDDDAQADNDDSWVSAETLADVVGPVMIVLPTEKASALACDPSGKVFALPIENIVDGNPGSAEPHDVRQVWVAHKLAGTESYRLKGHHGRFLACDKIGLLSAMSEAVGPNETFNVIPTSDQLGTFQLQTLRDTFLTAKDPPASKSSASAELRGDAETISFATTLRIRMQARFKPRFKAVKEEKALAKISRRELEEAVGRRLEEDDVRILKRARKEGDYHEKLLEIKVKGKHDKYS